MTCRACGACCVAISISSPIPGMPNGKPAGVRCLHLTEENLCALFERPERPAVCGEYQPSPDFCGESREGAMRLISAAELLTRPKTPVSQSIL